MERRIVCGALQAEKVSRLAALLEGDRMTSYHDQQLPMEKPGI
jgi:hypothetical protein